MVGENIFLSLRDNVTPERVIYACNLQNDTYVLNSSFNMGNEIRFIDF